MRRKVEYPTLVKELMSSGLFQRINSDYYNCKLRLLGTPFMLTVPITYGNEPVPEDLTWYRVKLGSYPNEDFAFAKNKPTYGQDIVKVSTETIFDEAPKKIAGKLAFYLNILPRN